MEQLQGLDASFLSAETPNAPMHVGSLLTFAPRNADDAFDFDRYRDLMSSRIHVSKVFRQRLATVPLGLGRPFWVQDPGFDVDFHLHHLALPSPHGMRELSRLVGRELGRPLDRARPLWEVTFVEGLNGVPNVPAGAFAMLTKVHHAAIDGVSGAEILGAFLDTTPEARAVPADGKWKPGPLPTDVDLLRRATGKVVTEPARLAELLAGTVRSAFRVGAHWGVNRVDLPPLPFRAPRTRFNVPVTAHRVWGGVVLSLDRIKALKNAAPGATVNDVVLAVCAGALRRLLLKEGELPSKPLVAMTPVSVRPEEAKRAAGNQISAMLVSLATDEPDPRKRLDAIQQGARRSKTYHHALGARVIMDYAQALPFAASGLAARLYTQLQLSRLHAPVFNVVITNVPGPQTPLYMGGARLLSNIGAGPIFDGIGLFMPVLSYAGTISIGVTSCREILPDVEGFCRFLEESVEELAKAVLPPPTRPRKPAAARKTAKRKQRRAA
jgi:diacylglycerol O-acyltransferase